MLGLFFMLLGILLFVVGIALFKTPTESKNKVSISATNQAVTSQNLSQGAESDLSTSISQKDKIPSQVIEAATKSVNQTNRTNEIGRLIDMAIADGVLTENEKAKIRSIANDYELEEEEIIRLTESKMAELGTDSETELININKKNGLDFEKFIIQKFNRKYFKIKNWAGDKYINGYYAEVNQQPDIQLEFSIGNRVSKLAVECKWRKKLNKGGVVFANETQLQRYKNFAERYHMPVFMAIGIGGNGYAPERLYVINIDECNTTFIDDDRLKRYEKPIDSNFFFDLEKTTLK